MKNVFKLTQKAIDDRKLIFHILKVATPVTVFILFSLIYSLIHKQLIVLILAFIISLIVIEIILFIQSNKIEDKLKKVELIFNNDYFELKNDKMRKRLQLTEIQKVQLISNSENNKALILKLFANNNCWTLAGYENMESLIKIIKEKIDKEVIVKKRNKNINWESPAMIWLNAIITPFILVGTMMLGLYDALLLLFSLSFGLYILIYRPAEKKGLLISKTTEILLGIILLIIGFFLFIIYNLDS